MILGLDTSTRRRVLAVLIDADGATVDRVRLDDVATASGITNAINSPPRQERSATRPLSAAIRLKLFGKARAAGSSGTWRGTGG